MALRVPSWRRTASRACLTSAAEVNSPARNAAAACVMVMEYSVSNMGKNLPCRRPGPKGKVPGRMGYF